MIDMMWKKKFSSSSVAVEHTDANLKKKVNRLDE